MEHKTIKNLDILNLVSDFESKFEQGALDYIDEKIIYQLIDYYENENLNYKAMEVVEIALEQFQYRSDFYIIKAKLQFKDGHINDCLESLAVAETFSPSEREILKLKIMALCSKKKIEEAKELLDSFVVNFPSDNVDYKIAESFIFEGHREYKAMYAALKEALTIDPNNEEALGRFWLAVDLAKEYEDSIAFCKSILDEQPYNHIAWYNLGLSYSYNWEYDKAIDALEYSFIINPSYEQGYIECAELCIQEGKQDKALEILKDANNRFGPDTELMVNIASCYLHLDKIAESRMILLKALKFDGQNEEIYFLLGETYSKTQSWYSAINAYHKAIEIDDSREEFLLALAKAYAQVEAFNKATIYFHKATKICPEESSYWKEYVCFIIKLGLYDEATQILEEAEDYTYGADLMYCMAAVLFFKKKKKAALTILEEALEDDFSQRNILFELAPELAADKDIHSMIKYFEKEYGYYM
jgi:tetratricopeptide (TPR) repeat protein